MRRRVPRSAHPGGALDQVDRRAQPEGHGPTARRAGVQQRGDGGGERPLADQAVEDGGVLAADPAAGGVPQQRPGELGRAAGGQRVDAGGEPLGRRVALEWYDERFILAERID